MTIKTKRHYATRVELLLYAQADIPEPFQVIALDPEHNHSFFFWHVFVVGLPAGTQRQGNMT